MNLDYQIRIDGYAVHLTLNDSMANLLYRPLRKIALRNGITLKVSADATA